MKATVTAKTAALAAAAAMPATGPSFFAPLNMLELAPDQVRLTPPSEKGIKEMAAMLLAQGQLNALQVTKDAAANRYLVHAGGRRLRGFWLLAKNGKIMTDFPVECKEIDAQEATAIGLMENISQESMHPADQYDAYKTLVDQGRTLESIATQYGVTLLHVQRRLKLASVAPELIALYRKGTLQLDQMMAFAQLDDQKRQVMLYKSLSSHNCSAQTIRRMIAEDEVSINDPRVKLVGLKTYVDAGGGVRSDLFSEKGERYLTDPLLLEMLVCDLMETHAAELRSQGWGFVDLHQTFTYNEKSEYFDLPTRLLDESPVHKAKRVTLENERQAAQKKLDECDDDDKFEELQDEVDKVNEKLDELEAQLVDTNPRDKDLGGVVLTIVDAKVKCLTNLAHVANRKQVLAEIAARNKRGAAKQEGQGNAQDSEGGASDGATDATEQGQQDSVPERLMHNLCAHRSAAIQACMVANQRVTLAALAQRMAISVFHEYRGGDEAVKVSRVNPWRMLESSSPTVGTSKAADVMNKQRKEWEDLLPHDTSAWLQWFIDQPLEMSLSMIVFATAESTQAMQSKPDSRDAAAHLAKALNLDMRQWWEPTSDNYLSLVPKSKILDAVVEAKGSSAAAGWDKLKKNELIDRAHDTLVGSGWLPSVLRTS
jgi:ParB family chromosome partitioning protein